MKAQALALIAFIFCLTAAQAKTVTGNGNIITKEVSVQSYDKIELGGSINYSGNSMGKKESPCFKYTQGKNSPLKITIDENLFPLLEIQSSHNCLTIRTDNNTQIRPTRFTIEGSSKELKEIDICNCLDFRAQNSIKGESLEIGISGSSDVVFEHPVQLRSCDFSISGSGDVRFSDLNCVELEGSVSGSGDIFLKGKAEKADYSVSGSGDISAYDFSVKKVECSVSGSGDAKVYATDDLDLSVSGSGEIKYKGSANVRQSKSGSGSIHRAN